VGLRSNLWCLEARGGRLDTMAVLVLLRVSPATHEAFDELDALVGQSMSSAGGPPAGLMSHVVYPEGDGLVVADVWRTEDEGRAYSDEVLRPLVAEVGLTAHETSVRAVWSFARP
jgi:hypothetical protein